MTKCHVTEELCGLYAALFMDAAAAFPALTSELLRDQDHLCQLVESRGIHLFLVDLPTAGKHLDRCLDAGQYSFVGLPLTKRVSVRNRIPRLFRGLYGLVFDELGILKEDYSVEAIFFLRQFHNCGKKTRFECRDKAVNETIESFVSVDESLPVPTWDWESGSDGVSDSLPFDHEYRFVDHERARHYLRALGHTQARATELLACLDSVADRATSTLGSYDPQEWRFRHGPGAIAETTRPINKYTTWNWSERLESEFPIADCGFHHWSAWAAAVDTEWADFRSRPGTLDVLNELESEWSTPTSRLVAVPKTFSGPRLIAVEPCAHMWCQQNILDYFVNRTRDSWLGKFIKFDDQTYNQGLCRKGSVDGSLVTLDLKDASDRMSCATVSSTFKVNPRLLRALAATRTHQIFIPDALYTGILDNEDSYGYGAWRTGDEHSALGKWITLRKFSTMGNACTFPVQSIVFATISIASTLLSRGLRVTEANIKKLEGEVAVFGDDIIVPKESRELVQILLEALGFKVNETKSFSGNNFRESCGIDCFRGVCVTPVYYKGPLTSKPESMASRVEVINNFKRKFLLHSSSYLAQAIPKHRKIVAVRVGSGVMGLEMYCKPIGQINKIRYNEHLQCTETLVLLIRSKNSKVPIHDDSALLQYFTEKPDPYTFWESGVSQRPSASLRRGWVKCEALQEIKAE